MRYLFFCLFMILQIFSNAGSGDMNIILFKNYSCEYFMIKNESGYLMAKYENGYEFKENDTIYGNTDQYGITEVWDRARKKKATFTIQLYELSYSQIKDSIDSKCKAWSYNASKDAGQIITGAVNCDYQLGNTDDGYYIAKHISGYRFIKGDFILGKINKKGLMYIYSSDKRNKEYVDVEYWGLTQNAMISIFLEKCKNP